jgi:hypothetical protein
MVLGRIQLISSKTNRKKFSNRLDNGCSASLLEHISNHLHCRRFGVYFARSHCRDKCQQRSCRYILHAGISLSFKDSPYHRSIQPISFPTLFLIQDPTTQLPSPSVSMTSIKTPSGDTVKATTQTVPTPQPAQNPPQCTHSIPSKSFPMNSSPAKP